MEKYYIVSEKDLTELITNNLIYKSLVDGGVNNWEWYGENFKDTKICNTPEELYLDPELNNGIKEMFDSGAESFEQLATAIIKYNYLQYRR